MVPKRRRLWRGHTWMGQVKEKSLAKNSFSFFFFFFSAFAPVLLPCTQNKVSCALPGSMHGKHGFCTFGRQEKTPVFIRSYLTSKVKHGPYSSDFVYLFQMSPPGYFFFKDNLCIYGPIQTVGPAR